MKTFLSAVLAVFVISAAGLAQEHQHTPLKTSPQFEEMKKLIGKWEGTFTGGGKGKAEFRMTGGGSAIMEIMDPGGKYEMVTMYHMDGDRLLATHYCAAHNQPRMAAVSGSPEHVVEFKYVDGTNIVPGASRMDSVKLTMVDADHHKELWTSTENGKSDSMDFDYHRVQ